MNGVQENVMLAPLLSLRTGGPARYICSPRTVSETQEHVHWVATHGLPVLVLGKGSNLCVSDSGWPGLVINLGARLCSTEWNGRSVRCDAGVPLRALVHESVTRGLAGIERLAGIPGTLGGAVFMNAGAFGQEVSTVIEEVEYIELSSGQSCRASRDELGFGYRTSRFAGTDAVITSCRCSFASGNRAALECEYHQVLTRRRQKQPLDLPNCGSVFKNPPGQGAGRHIESAGLKGVRVGGIQVSTKHANFFVNTGLGTASDFRKLVAVVQRAVHERTGLLLEPEVAFVGHFDIPLYQPET